MALTRALLQLASGLVHQSPAAAHHPAARTAVRGVASSAAGAGSEQSAVQAEESKPTYVYQSPGSSLKEPGYGTGNSLSNPSYVYVRDPRPAPKPAAAPAPKANASSASQRSTAAPAPSYVYASPGSSMREASYGFSTRDPVYVVDPKPSSSSGAAAAK